jgi:hypothetical protein
MNHLKPSSYACVSPDDVIVAKGNKKRMLAFVKKNNGNKKGYYLGMTPKQVGEKFK